LAAIEFGPKRFKQLQEAFVAAGNSRTYVNRNMDIIKSVWKCAVSEELLPPSRYEALRSVPGLRQGRTRAPERPPVKPVSDEVIEATLPHMPGHVADMVRFQRLTGARPGEVCKMKVADIDRSGDVWDYRLAKHKTAHRGKERVVYIGP
jgi:integrase